MADKGLGDKVVLRIRETLCAAVLVALGDGVQLQTAGSSSCLETGELLVGVQAQSQELAGLCLEASLVRLLADSGRCFCPNCTSH